MKLWVTGDESDGLRNHLRRRLPVEISTGQPHGTGRHAVVSIGAGLDDGLLDTPGLEMIVLVEPGNAERDRLTRLLAGFEHPRLHTIEHVAADIHAERTWAIVLSLLARIPTSTHAMRADPVARSDLVVGPPSGESLLDVPEPVSPDGLTLGFVGFRPMARSISVWAGQMGMRLLYASLGTDQDDAVDMQGAALRSGALKAPFDDVLAMSDVLVLDVGYGEDSIRLLDAPELSLMRDGAYLVNTAHGRAIDEGALIQALRAGRFSGVALDRFNYEPLPGDSPLRQFDTALLTPGICVPSNETTLERVALRVADLVSSLEPDIVVRRVRHARPRVNSARRK